MVLPSLRLLRGSLSDFEIFQVYNWNPNSILVIQAISANQKLSLAVLYSFDE